MNCIRNYQCLSCFWAEECPYWQTGGINNETALGEDSPYVEEKTDGEK